MKLGASIRHVSVHCWKALQGHMSKFKVIVRPNALKIHSGLKRERGIVISGYNSAKLLQRAARGSGSASAGIEKCVTAAGSVNSSHHVYTR